MEILFLILSIVFFILWNKEKKSSKAKADQASETLAAANKRLDELSKYQDIRDVEAHCKKLRQSAEQEAEQIRSKAQVDADMMRPVKLPDRQKPRLKQRPISAFIVLTRRPSALWIQLKPRLRKLPETHTMQ